MVQSAKPEIAKKIKDHLKKLLQRDTNIRMVKFSIIRISICKREVDAVKNTNEFMIMFNNVQDYRKAADEFLIQRTVLAKYLLQLADKNGINFNDLENKQLSDYVSFIIHTGDSNIRELLFNKLKCNNQSAFFKKVYVEA